MNAAGVEYILFICLRRVILYFLFMGIGVYGIYKLFLFIFRLEDPFKMTKQEKEYHQKKYK